MIDKKYEFKKIEELVIKGEHVGDVWYKPRYVPTLITLIGLLFLLMKNIFGIIICILFSGFGLLLIFWVKDHRVFSVYKECVVILDDRNHEGTVIYNDNIKEWNVELKESNRINFILNEDQVLSRASFRCKDATKYLSLTMPEKNTLNLPKEEEETFLSWLIGSIKNLINKFKNNKN